MKLISDLKLGDKVFVINKRNSTFDIAEVIEILNAVIRFQCYLNNDIFYLWRHQENKFETDGKIIFTNEIEALEVFKQLLWQQ